VGMHEHVSTGSGAFRHCVKGQRSTSQMVMVMVRGRGRFTLLHERAIASLERRVELQLCLGQGLG
jgi:hypothetical protein